jgi:hypothetical protein
MISPPKKTQFELVPNGTHIARLYEIILIGTIPTNWQGQEKMTTKIRLTFELCNERKEFKPGEGEKPFSISREFTYSYGAKGNLRPFVEGMTGSKVLDDESPDLEALLGEACLLNVVHTAKDGVTYANIQGATPLVKGMEAPELFNKPRAIDINSIPFGELDTLPEFIQKKMKSSEEYGNRVRHSGNMAAAGLDEGPVHVPGEPPKLQMPHILGGPASAEEGQLGDRENPGHPANTEKDIPF